MYNTIAVRMNRVRLLIWGGLFTSLAASFYVVFSSQHTYDTDMQLAFFVLPLWFFSMIVLIRLFHERLPDITSETGLFKRLAIRFRRLFSWMAAWLFTLVTLAIFYLSYRAVLFYA